MFEGEATKKLFPIPCAIRFSDGEYFEAGTVINFGLKLYIIKRIFISNDLQAINVAVSDPEAILEEELMLELDELLTVPTENINDILTHKCRKAAQDNRSNLEPIVCHFPFHITNSRMQCPA